MKNIIFDINIILDFNSKKRDEKFPDSRKVFELTKNLGYTNIYLSSSSLDNIEFLKYQQLLEDFPEITKKQRQNIARHVIKELLSDFKIAKTPSYVDINYEDIEDSLVIASAKSIDARVVTRDKGMLLAYPDITVTSEQLINELNMKNNHINFIDLGQQYFNLQPQIEKNMDEVLNSTSFIIGNKVRELEEKLADFVGVKYCIGVSSGTDALLISLMALSIKAGDEVITTPFTFIATAEVIALLGARPVFVDIEPNTYNINPDKIESAITPKTKAIMPVSLYGQCADFDRINAIAEKYQLPVIEDGAQSLGATYKGRQSCSLSTIGCTSFFPSKPLGGYGDAGACFTDDDELAKSMREIRAHGQDRRYHHPRIGINGRLDTLQAAVLLAKLDIFPDEVEKRRIVGENYTKLISKHYPGIVPPYIKEGNSSVYAQYTIQTTQRDALIQKLSASGIPTAVHYPVPLNKQPVLNTNEFELSIAEELSNKVMSLPMHPYLTETEQQNIVKTMVSDD